MVLRRTQLAAAWRAGSVETLAAEAYLAWLADFVERLAPEQVLHRIAGDAPAAELLAPTWSLDKNALAHGLERELERRGTRQGSALAVR